MVAFHFAIGPSCCGKIVKILLFPLQELQKSSSSRKGDQGASEKTSLESIQSSVPLFLQYPVPYTQDAPTPLLVSQSPSKLHFGNPYSLSDSKGLFPFQKVTHNFCWKSRVVFTVATSLNSLPADEGDEEFSDDQLLRLPPVGPPSWDSNVVCIQPTRNHSRPDGHEESEEKQNNNNVSLSDSPFCIPCHVQYPIKFDLFFSFCEWISFFKTPYLSFSG